MPKNPGKQVLFIAIIVIIALALMGVVAYQVPSIKERLAWRVDIALTYLRGVINPVKPFPTPAETAILPTPVATNTPASLPTLVSDQPTATLAPTATPLPSPTPIPAAVQLPPPLWEQQGPNNCGPATLALYLRFYGWEGNQDDIAKVVKPIEEDRNVNPDELVYFVRTHTGWLGAEFRVGGDLGLLKQLVAAGFPVMIEESFYFDTPYWPNDDLWAAHYLLVTGYDDTAQTFTGQDSFHGPNQIIAAATLDNYWQIFNRVYLLVYPTASEGKLKRILADNWDADLNRQQALEVSQAETQSAPKNAYAWFNLGSNLVYFERWGEAASAYDQARELGLYQRMLRYQFGPFFAYFNDGETTELIAVTEYALQRTPNSEEALLWHGWAEYRLGKKVEARADWEKALEYRPGYPDAQYALDFLASNP
ncbi:MAG TPA: C39 family peptidase [Anaerolineales bacterium]|nr:C39 family peptidase [Anaerolineales bacterium]